MIDASASFATIVVPCASRKAHETRVEGRAVSLPRTEQSDLITAWLSRLSELSPVCPAWDLYRGRGFALSRQAAELVRAPLFVISAGLGLVDARTRVPSYGVTVADRGQDSIVRKVRGTFDPAAWWAGIAKGPYSTRLATLLSERSGIAVVALSRPYAAMVGQELSGLPDGVLQRVRIVGLRLTEILPPNLAPQVMQYDERLDAALPGTRADFAQRALFHFATTCGEAFEEDATHHRLAVEGALAERVPPARPRRQRLSDEQVLDIIKRHLPSTRGVARLLSVVRHIEGIACEQARFSRLYRLASTGGRIDSAKTQ